MYSAGYCAAKHGLVGLTRALAIEFTKERLRVNAVCPGGMLTPQVTEFQAPENADYNLIMRIAAPRGMMAPVDVPQTRSNQSASTSPGRPVRVRSSSSSRARISISQLALSKGVHHGNR